MEVWFFIIFLVSVFLITCSSPAGNEIKDEIGDDAGDGSGDDVLASVNIQGMEALFITSTDAGNKLYGVKARNGGSPTTYRNGSRSIAGEGQIVEISFLNSKGEAIEKNDPVYVFNLKNFIVLAFGYSSRNREGFWVSIVEAYLVNKSSGKVFAIPEYDIPNGRDFRGGGNEEPNFLFDNIDGVSQIQEDGNNNIYYITTGNRPEGSLSSANWLNRVSLDNPSTLQFQQVSAVNDVVEAFCVDWKGNILYTFHEDLALDPKYRYRKAAGGFINFSVSTVNGEGEEGTIQLVWTGTDGQMYAINKTISYPNESSLGKIQDGEFVSVKDMNTKITKYDYSDDYGNHAFNIGGGIFYSQEGTLFNLSNETDYAEIPCPLVANLVIGGKLYNFDEDTLVLTQIHTATGSITQEYDLNETALSSLDIDHIVDVALDGITFNALDLNSGDYVVAKLSTDGRVTNQSAIAGRVLTVHALH